MGSTPKLPALRSVLGDQVKDHLLQAILTGRYAPGARIVETRVARELGVSQSPVREALRDLAALGVVEMPAFRGARVRRPSMDELQEAYVVRAELEVLAARLALPRLVDADLEDLDGLIEQMQQSADRSDLRAEAIADAAFHSRIVELAGNAVLERMWRNLEPFPRTYITIVARGVAQGQIADLHRPLVEAFRSRDADRVTEAIRHHFEEASAMMARHLEDQAGARSGAAGTDHPDHPGHPGQPGRTGSLG
jgi:DNA-binding GntR family transcriptional regulator